MKRVFSGILMLLFVLTMSKFDNAYSFNSGKCSMAKQHGCMISQQGKYGMKLLQKLNLTEDQSKKIKTIRSESAIKKAPLESDLKVLNIKLKGLLDADTPNKMEIEAMIDKIAAKRAEIQKVNINTMLDIKKELTEDQLKKAKEFFSKPGDDKMRHPRKSMQDKKIKPRWDKDECFEEEEE